MSRAESDAASTCRSEFPLRAVGILDAMDRGTANGGSLDAPRITPEQLSAAMPPRVREAFPLFGWTEETLWQLDRPVEEFPVDTFD